MTYDYMKAMVEDIKDAIEDYEDAIRECSDIDEVKSKLNDDMWIDDSITGNGSGSYTFNSAKAAEYLVGNSDILVDAMEEFGSGPDQYKEALTNPEYADVTIRCYLLGQAIDEAFEDPDIIEYVERILGENDEVESDNRKIVKRTSMPSKAKSSLKKPATKAK